MEKAQTSGCLDDLLDVEGRSLPRFDSPKIQGLGELDGLLLLGEVGLLFDEWPPEAPVGQLLQVRIGDHKVSYCPLGLAGFPYIPELGKFRGLAGKRLASPAGRPMCRQSKALGGSG